MLDQFLPLIDQFSCKVLVILVLGIKQPYCIVINSAAVQILHPAFHAVYRIHKKDDTGTVPQQGYNLSLGNALGNNADLIWRNMSAPIEVMDPTTRERRALGHWKETGQGTTRAYLHLLSHGYAYVTICRETYDPQTFTYQTQPVEKTRISLSTGESQSLAVKGDILAASADHIFTVERINDDDNYGPEPTYAILREYNLTDGTYRMISDTADGFRTTPDPNTTYGNLLIWQRGDTLLVTDVSTLEEREVLTMPNIVNYWVMDNRAFFITRDDAGICKVYHQLLTGGDPVQLYNEGQTDGMVYGIIEEGNDYFAGPYHEKSGHLCSKQDFYAERYDT